MFIFVYPTEHACHLKCEEERSQLICKTSYETTQSHEMAYEELQFLFASWSECFEDNFHLGRINFNSPLGYHKP